MRPIPERLSLATFAAPLLCLAGMAQAQQPASPPPAQQQRQQPDGAEYWTPSSDRMTFTAAGISFPRRAGAVRFTRSIAFGRTNAGLDNALLYASDDNALIATAYVYLPGLARNGYSAVATGYAMQLQSDERLRKVGSGIAAAGGRDGVAIRTDYAGFRDNEASSSAFLHVGRWIVKLRVSGPETRRADVERTIAALLADLRFQGRDQPLPAEPMEVAGDCQAAAAGPAATLRALDGAEAAEDAIMAAAEALPERTGHSGFPRTWCLSSFRQAGEYRMPIFRVPPSTAEEDSRRSVAVAMISDSDAALEVVERRFRHRSRFTLIHHRNAESRILGSYDGPPTDAQLAAIIDGSDPAGNRARATIGYTGDGNSTVTLNVSPDLRARPERPPSR